MRDVRLSVVVSDFAAAGGDAIPLHGELVRLYRSRALRTMSRCSARGGGNLLVALEQVLTTDQLDAVFGTAPWRS